MNVVCYVLEGLVYVLSAGWGADESSFQSLLFAGCWRSVGDLFFFVCGFFLYWWWWDDQLQSSLCSYLLHPGVSGIRWFLVTFCGFCVFFFFFCSWLFRFIVEVLLDFLSFVFVSDFPDGVESVLSFCFGYPLVNVFPSLVTGLFCFDVFVF